MTGGLTAADIAFIGRVAARRFAGGEPVRVDTAAVEAAIAGSAAATVYARAARLAAGLLRSGAVSPAPLHTALLVLHCALSLEGLSLLAPQGVLVGMVRALQAEPDTATVERWLEDRSVPSASGG